MFLLGLFVGVAGGIAVGYMYHNPKVFQLEEKLRQLMDKFNNLLNEFNAYKAQVNPKLKKLGQMMLVSVNTGCGFYLGADDEGNHKCKVSGYIATDCPEDCTTCLKYVKEAGYFLRSDGAHVPYKDYLATKKNDGFG